MPQIPAYRADVQLGNNAPQELVNPREAQALSMGSSLQDFGGDVMQYGAKMRAREIAKEQTERHLMAANIGRAFEEESIQAENEARQGADASWSNVVPKYQERVSKWEKQALKGVDDEETRLKILGNIAETRVNTVRKLSTEANKGFNDYVVSQNERQVNAASAMVQRNPLAFNDQFSKTVQFFVDPQNHLSGAEKQKAIELSRKSLAKSAIEGWTSGERPDFDTAKDWMTDKFGSVFDQKERQEIMDRIKLKEAQFINQDWKKDSADMELSAAREKFAQDNQLDGLVKTLKTAGPTLDPQATDELQRILTNKVQSGDLSKLATEAINRSVISGDGIQDNDAITQSLYTRVASDSDGEGLREDILKAARDGQLSKDTFIDLMSNAPSGKVALQNKTQSTKLLTIQSQAIDAYSKDELGIVSAKNKENVRRAKSELYQLVANGPKELRGNPEAAGRYVISKYFGNRIKGKIPGVSVKGQEDLPTALAEIKAALNKKKISPAQAKERTQQAILLLGGKKKGNP